MRKLGKDEHLIRLAFIGVLLTLGYLTVLIPWGFLEGARLHSYDSYCRWRNKLQPPPAELNQILLVTIDEDSQRHLSKKWPWDRSLFAEFIDDLGEAEPKLILMDLVLSGESQEVHDASLTKAIREGPPILLASYLDRHGGPVMPLPRFIEAGARAGLINKPRDLDLVVRRLWAAIRVPMQSKPLFAIEAYAAAILNNVPPDSLELSRSLSIGSLEVPLEPPGAMAINYLAFPEQIPTVSFWEVIQKQVDPDLIRGRIVLVGSAREITHDIYPTSLGLMPGVTLSANGILTLISERFVRNIPLPLVLLFGFTLIYCILVATYKLSLLRGILVLLGVTGLSVTVGFLCVLLWDLRAESLSIVILAGVAWLIGALYKYTLLVADLVRLHRQVATDPNSGALTARYFQLRLEAVWSVGRRSTKSLLILRTEQLSELVQKISWEEARKQVRVIAEITNRLKSREALVGQLTDGELGIYLPGFSVEKATRWAERLRGEISTVAQEQAMGLACSNQAPISTPIELIHCAQAALTRAGTKGVGTLETFNPELDKVSLGGKTAPAQTGQATEMAYIESELEERNKSLEQALASLRETNKEMANHFLEVTKALVVTMETKDEYTAGHLERVSRYATRLAEELSLPKEEIEAIKEAALLHDIGKVGIPDEVLHKVGKLNDEEMNHIKKHLEIGAKILDPMKFFKPITTLIYHHHERYDGKGYPHGLTGEFIPPGAQVISVVDSFDAMTTNRGYNKPMSVAEAVAELRAGSGSQFNPTFVEKFARIIEAEGPQLAGYKPSE